MRFLKFIAAGTLLLAGQFVASAAEVAVLRSGSQITFVRKEEISATTTRLYLASGHLDIDTAEIASIEKEESPVAVPDSSKSLINTVSTTDGPNASGNNPAAVAANVPPGPKAGVIPATTTHVTQPELDQFVRDAAARNRLDPDFVASVIRAESNFKPHAVSPKGAQGLMQLMPSTAAKLGVTDPFDPKANIEAGTAHLNDLLNLYHDDPVKALAAYNAGAHRVQQYHGVPPYRETRAYVSKIVRDFNAKKQAETKNTKLKTASESAKTPTKATPASSATSTRKKIKASPQQASVPKTNKPA